MTAPASPYCQHLCSNCGADLDRSPVLNVKEAAKYLGVSEKHMRRMCTAADIDVIRFGRCMVIRVAVLDALHDANEVKARPASRGGLRSTG
jgi:excisionase family DNA binding protein